ncbi:MAG: amidohydrolase family protein [Candidatus Thermoplasmatota archaeon]|nr:amidohydrolase family protein [Candidatus Thermoplasmatota archaeon]MCL6089448.1 amidohydrolase family protein [Candidatus Thermoplasmatota archaeon]MDA8144091.1 amidohydrolase family protein [Thermoplasmatales archaeon]
MSSLFIHDAIIVTQNSAREVLRGNILVRDGKIESVGKEHMDADSTVEAGGKIAIPGLINTHCHVAMTHLRGKLDDISLEKFLERTFKLDSERSNAGIYNSSLLGMYEMLDSGITSFVDLYYSEEVIAKAVRESGIRGFLSWVTLDEDKTTQKGSPLKNAERFISNFRNDELVIPSVGIQGVYAAGDEVYLGAKELAEKKDTIIHGHLAETREEVYNFLNQHNGVRPTEHLEKIGFLNPRFLAAHGVWNTLHEVRLMGKNGVKLSWNPVSNAKLGIGGMAPVPEYLANGVSVSIGSDSCGSNNTQDVFQGMKFGSIWVKSDRWNPAITNAQAILDMATVNAAASLNRPDLGSLEPGKSADIVLLDTRTPRLMLTDEITAVSNIVYSADASCVSDVIVNGRLIKSDGHLAKFNSKDFQDAEFV